MPKINLWTLLTSCADTLGRDGRKEMYGAEKADAVVREAARGAANHMQEVDMEVSEHFWKFTIYGADGTSCGASFVLYKDGRIVVERDASRGGIYKEERWSIE